eukprot:PhM_4_TR13942/c4_g1_i1/m.5384
MYFYSSLLLSFFFFLFVFYCLLDVQLGVDVGRDGLDLRVQLLLDAGERRAVIGRNEVDGDAEVSEATAATDTVEVRLGVLREVEVDDDVHGLDVNAAGDKVTAHKVAALALAEVVEDAVAVLLEHAGVDVVAGVPQLRDLLGQELDAVDAVAEDDGLVDLETREERVQAVDLLALLDVGVELGDTDERELVHEVDLEGVLHVLVAEVLNRHGEGGREEQRLALLANVVEDVVHELGELGREQLIGLVEDHHVAAREVGDVLGGQVEHTAGRRDEDVHGVVQTHDVLAEGRAAGRDHDVHLHVLSELLRHLRRLEGELARGHEEEGLHGVDFGVHLLERRDDEGGGLAGAVLGARHDVLAGEGDGDGLLLDGRGALEALLEDAHEQLALEEVVLEGHLAARADVVRLHARVLGWCDETLLPVVSLVVRRGVGCVGHFRFLSFKRPKSRLRFVFD